MISIASVSDFVLRRFMLDRDDLVPDSFQHSFGEWIIVRNVVLPVSVSLCQQAFDRSYVGSSLVAF